MAKIQVHNVETGEVIERPLTADEVDQIKKDELAAEAKIENATAKTAKRQELLDKLGITAEEATLLIG
jgi:DNA-binding protein H-NS